MMEILVALLRNINGLALLQSRRVALAQQPFRRHVQQVAATRSSLTWPSEIAALLQPPPETAGR